MPRQPTKSSDSYEQSEADSELAPLPEPEKKTVAPKPVVVRQVQRPVRRVSFEQWAKLRGIKQSHKGGMKAFVPNPDHPRSMQGWDKVFADY